MRNYSEENIRFLESIAPYIRDHINKIFVLKVGGEVLGKTLPSLAHEIAILYQLGINIIIVHGGGTQINDYSKEIGLKPKSVHGLRVTDEETLERAVRPIMGELNSNIVDKLNEYALNKYTNTAIVAVGLQRANMPSLIKAKKAPPRTVGSGRNKKTVDLGLVGEVEDVDTTTLDRLLTEGYSPVISSLGMDSRGTIYNVNADTVAGAIASRIRAEKLVILTDVLGVYRNPKKKKNLISYMDTEEARTLIKEGIVSGGMLPKVEACITTIDNGVHRTHIVKGIDSYSLINEVLGPGTGTMIVSPAEKIMYERELAKNYKR